MKKQNVLISASLIFLAMSRANAVDPSLFSQNVSTSVLSQLQASPTFEEYKQRQVDFSIRTRQPIAEKEAKQATRDGILIGNYRRTREAVSVQVEAKIDQGQIDVNFPLSRIDAIIEQWEEEFREPAELKSLFPRVKQLTFRQGMGLIYECLLKREFSYLLKLEIPYDADNGQLVDRKKTLKEVKKFITAMEGDKRMKTILANNTSGRPVLLTIAENNSLQARHPMNSIEYDPAAKSWTFAYIAELEKVKNLPEVKRLLADEAVKTFLSGVEQGTVIKVSVNGGEKEGFTATLTNLKTSQRISAQIVQNKVSIEDPQKGG